MRYGHIELSEIHYPSLSDIPDGFVYDTKSKLYSRGVVVLRALPSFLFAIWKDPNPPTFCTPSDKKLGGTCMIFHSPNSPHLFSFVFFYSGNVIQNPFYISSNQVVNFEEKWEERKNEEKEENLWEQTDDDEEKMQESP